MYSPGRGVRLRSNAITNTGKVRENNEDHVYLWEDDGHFALAIVADGMGGAVAGEEASRIAVQTIRDGLIDENIQDAQIYENLPADVISDKLRSIVRRANSNIVQQTIELPELKGMGTTVTMAVIRNTYAVIGHVGDSRAYLVDGHDGNITQITSDHSFVEAMVAAGYITREEAEDHPMKNVLYRALGQADEIDVDVYHSYLRAGDRLVLCSDGLTLHVDPEEIAKLALSDNNPIITSQKLIDLANSRGGRDNVTVIVINVEEDHTSDQSHTQEADEFSEDETLILKDRDRGHFVSSESSSSPTPETQDSNPYNYKPVSSSKNSYD